MTPSSQSLEDAINSAIRKCIGDIGLAQMSILTSDHRVNSQDRRSLDVKLDVDIGSRESLNLLIAALSTMRAVDSDRVSTTILDVSAV